MKKSLSLILITLSLVSCKMDGTKPTPNKEVTGYGGMEVPQDKNFSAPEIGIGKHICSLLKEKRKMLESYRYNQKQKLIFTAENKKCGQNLAEDEFAVTGNSLPTPFKVYVDMPSRDFVFVAPTRNSGDHFEDIITRDSGAIKDVCDSLEKTGDIARQYFYGSHKLVVKFLIQNGMERVEITQYSPASKGGYALANVEGISFIGSTKQGPAVMFGLEKERARYTPCGGNQAPSSLIQIWQDLTTDL